MLPVIRTLLPRLLKLVAIAWVSLILIAVVIQRRLIYVPPREYFQKPSDARLPFVEERVTTSDGQALVGWWIPPPVPRAPVVLFFHGNACNLSALVDTAKELRELGAGFAAVDYRGYGGSTGWPTELGLRRDALAAYEWVTRRHGTAPGRVFPWGQSLGSGVASWLAAEKPCAGLVLESAIPSILAMTRRHYPWLPVPEFLLWDRFRTVDHAARASCPVLILHGDRDVITPFASGEAIRDAIVSARGAGAVRLVRVRGVGHDGIHPRHPDVAPAWTRFVRFVIDGVSAGR